MWKGKFGTLPAVDNYSAGDVVGVGNKEYVLTVTGDTKAWVEFGDEGSYLLKSTAESTYLKKNDASTTYAPKSHTHTKSQITDFPTIPTVNDAKVTIKMNGSEKGNFTLNQSSTKEIDLGTVITQHQDISGKLDKAKLTPILKEIDLTGTDAERKAKLDQFEADWKALTGSDSLNGARFVGNDGSSSALMVYSPGNAEYEGVFGGSIEQVPNRYTIATSDGSLTITPLFQHLEAVVLRISDGDSNADTVNAANKTSIENYVANLQSLGVSIEDTPCHFRLLKYKNGNYTDYTVNVGILKLTEKYGQYDFWIDGVKGSVDYDTGKVTISSNLNTTLEAITIYTDNTEEHMQMNLDNIAAYEANLEALGVNQHTVPYPISLKGSESDTILYSGYITPPENGVSYAGVVWERIVSGDITNIKSVVINQDSNNGEIFIRDIAISPNEVSNYYVSKSLNAKSLEAVTIKTSNSDTGKAANVAAIKAYVNNLKSLGVDITKGYMIPVIMNGANGFVTYSGDPTSTSGLGFTRTPRYSQATIIMSDGTAQGYLMLDAVTNYYTLTTTSKQIVGAINEVNAAVKTKASNIKDASSTGGINQAFDGGETLDVTSKNPNATALDSTITGALTRGATGQYASSFGGKSIAMGKRSFAEGTTTIAKGNYSHAEGDNSVALGSDSHVEGYQTTTGPSAMGAHAEGNGTQSLGAASHSEGSSTIAKGNTSHAEGADTKANGVASHAEGNGTKGDGNYSHAEGNGTSAIGSSSHAEGYITIAQGDMSHAEGALTKAIGSHSHTEGSNNTTNAGNSHAEGANNTVNNSKYTAPSGGSSGSTGSTEPSEPADFNIEEHYGEGGHAEGMYNNAYGYASHAEGAHNKSKAHYSHTEGQGNDASGEGAHAEGWGTIASGAHSHSEGQGTKAIGVNAHAEGNGSKATGSGSHAEGSGTAQGVNAHAEGASIADNSNAHAEGLSTTASGNGAHSEGNYAQATNNAAHAEGVHTTANGDGSHAEGWYTTAKNRAEHAEGFFNFSNSVSPSYYTEGNNTLHSVGIGTSASDRKNALEIMQNGDIYAYGVGGYDGTNAVNNASKTLKTVIESKQDKLVSGTNIKTVNGQSLLGSGDITVSGEKKEVTIPITGVETTLTSIQVTAFKDPNTNIIISMDAGVLPTDIYSYDDSGNVVYRVYAGTLLAASGVAFMQFRVEDSKLIYTFANLSANTPVDDTDVANKKYVDDKFASASGGGSGSATELHASIAAGETPFDIKLNEDDTTIAVEYENGGVYRGAGMVFTKFGNASSDGDSSHAAYITNICGKGITIKTKEFDGSVTDKTDITGNGITTGWIYLSSEILENTQAVNKKYVDDQITAKLGTVLTQLQSI